jgi:tetratricopeptide (TPR) repeat protein
MNDLLDFLVISHFKESPFGYDWSPTFSTGDPPEFMEIFKSATASIDEDPKNAQAYFMRGLVCQSKRWYPEALADFLEVVKNDPRHAKAWLLMSEVLAALGDADKARMARQQALEIDPAIC